MIFDPIYWVVIGIGFALFMCRRDPPVFLAISGPGISDESYWKWGFYLKVKPLICLGLMTACAAKLVVAGAVLGMIGCQLMKKTEAAENSAAAGSDSNSI